MIVSLTAERLRDVLHYNPESGKWTWVKPTSWRVSVGDEAGCFNKSDGYIYIGIDKQSIGAHRLAFFYMTGEFPVTEVDHKNCIKTDNRWENLRLATRTQNSGNRLKPRHNSSGYKGVSWHAGAGKWQVHISVGDVSHYLGLYEQKEKAAEAYLAAATAIHGDFARAA